MEPPEPDREAVVGRRSFLAGLPGRHREGGLLFVHASPCNSLTEYVFPQDIQDREKMSRLFGAVEQFCFLGHTHIPGVFTRRPGEPCRFLCPSDAGRPLELGAGKALVNVGSVGQPRDGDPRACYALFDGESVLFRRVGYDPDATARKLRAAGDLDGSLTTRLFVGP
jgi:diadenosine tetraphosphatase ApaH/serine/threonine PP2A family protein phosphatase